MQTLTLALLVLCCSMSIAGSFRTREIQSLSHLQQELQMLHRSEEAIVANYLDELRYGETKSRGIRSYREKKCGQKLLAYAQSICNETRTVTEENIATKCCSEGCDEKYIRFALCPDP